LSLTEENGRDGQMQFVDQPRLQILAQRRDPTAEPQLDHRFQHDF